MKKHIDTSFTPLFDLKRDQYFTVKFEYKAFTCVCQKKKQEFTYKDIRRLETEENGVIIYLNNNSYISIATENNEKHNSALYDIVTFLKKRCRSVFVGKVSISYPENDDDGRYKTNEEPAAQISFVLSGAELKRMLWYDYLFGERMLVFIVPSVVFLFLSIILRNIWLLVGSAAIIVFTIVLSESFFEGIDGYIKNHKGQLFMLMYDGLLVVRLRNTDLELEYSTMKRKKTFLGLWRLKSDNFFVLILPKRIEKENHIFFDKLYTKIV